jgi:hypothetical protein
MMRLENELTKRMDTHLVEGDFFTKEQWRGPMAPFIADLIDRPGGVLLLAVAIDPKIQNYPTVGFAVFSQEERADLRAWLLKCRKKREANSAGASSVPSTV